MKKTRTILQNNNNELKTNSHYPKGGLLHLVDKILNDLYLLARTQLL